MPAAPPDTVVTLAQHDIDGYVEWAGFVGDEPVFASAEGVIHFPTGVTRQEGAHDGLLSAALSKDGQSLVTGGEDGRVVSTSADGTHSEIADLKGKWIDVVCGGPQGAVAFAAGRTVWLAVPGRDLKEFPHERAVEAIAFAPKGLRIACARYNGVSLHWGAGDAKPVDLHWDGAHTGIVFSPDGRYIVTTMAENALHGWRLDNVKSAEGAHMRMSGYPAKPKSLSWSAKGKWLASSGAPAAVCWPFTGKDGPMGKAPKELGTRGDSLVTVVACHPSEDVVAVGYADGMVMAVRIDDAAESLLRRPGKGAISTMNWDANGNRLAFGSEEGEAGIISLA